MWRSRSAGFKLFVYVLKKVYKPMMVLLYFLKKIYGSSSDYVLNFVNLGMILGNHHFFLVEHYVMEEVFKLDFIAPRLVRNLLEELFIRDRVYGTDFINLGGALYILENDLQVLVSEEISGERLLHPCGALFPCGALQPESTCHFGIPGGGAVVSGSLEGPWKLEEDLDQRVRTLSSSPMPSSGLHPAEDQPARCTPCTSTERPAGPMVFIRESHRMGRNSFLKKPKIAT